MTLQSIETRLCVIAAAALAAGTLVYVYARGAVPSTALLALCLGSLPSLLHTTAFTLFSLAVVAPWPRLVPAVCAMWLAIECAFEALQSPAIADAMHVSDLATRSSLLRVYLNGTFDPADLLAAVAGALLAGWIATRTSPHRTACVRS
jgi:hypothetical protein